MTLLPLIVAAGMSQTATAGDGVGIRLKVNTDLFNVASTKPAGAESDSEEAEEGDEAADAAAAAVATATIPETRATTIGFFQSMPRFEATYIITPNIEAGLVFGYAINYGEVDGLWATTETHRNVGVTFAYNLKLSDGLRGYVQPLFILGKAGMKDYEGESLGHMSTMQYGGDLGLRIKLVKGATFDPSFEYLAGSVKTFDAAGTENEAFALKTGAYGLKAGISVKF